MSSFKRPILVAFGSVPKDGGTFTFYRNLRKPLLDQGIDLRCITVGKREAALWKDSFADEGCELFAENEASIKKQAEAFCQRCQQIGVDIVMGVNSIAILSALPHLPANIRIMSRCANAFDHGYRITVSSNERLSRIVALAPGQIDALVNNYGAERSRITLIPNGTSSERFANAATQERGTEKALRLGFLGRMEHNQKGVLFLPAVLDRLHDQDIDFKLLIAGKGVHEPELRLKLRTHIESGDVKFVGSLHRDEIADFFSKTDIYLFPSQFEGSPNALIEALMAGCVPVAWKLDGITDFVIKDKETGLLAELGDCTGMADLIIELASDRSRLQQVSRNAAADARRRFSRKRVVGHYAELINQVMQEPPMPWQPKSWSEFRIDAAFQQPLWRRSIPVPLKRLLKKSLIKLNRPARNA